LQNGMITLRLEEKKGALRHQLESRAARQLENQLTPSVARQDRHRRTEMITLLSQHSFQRN
jgi:hypothetical protein